MATIEHERYAGDDAFKELMNCVYKYINDAIPKINVTVPDTAAGNSFSLDEKVIGTWIDSKPLYQKTFYIDLSGISEGTSVLQDISDLNIDEVFPHDSFIRRPDKNNSVPIFCNAAVENGNANFSIQTKQDGDGQYISGKKEIYIIRPYNNSGCTDAYVTIRYTKTTD